MASPQPTDTERLIREIENLSSRLNALELSQANDAAKFKAIAKHLKQLVSLVAILSVAFSAGSLGLKLSDESMDRLFIALIAGGGTGLVGLGLVDEDDKS